MRRVVPLLREKLAGADFIEQVEVVEAFEGEVWTLVSDPLPDLCLLLSMRVVDHLSPPLVDFHISSTLEHHSVTCGIETAAARYQLAAENLATALADDVQKGLSELVSKHGRMEQLSESFYGQGDSVPPDLLFTDHPAVNRHYSGPRLMVHNETCWSLRTDSPRDWLQDFAEQLEAGGWRVTRHGLDQVHSSPHLRAVHENNWVLEAFQPGGTTGQSEPREADSFPRLVLQFQHRFSRADVYAAVESLMTDPLDIAQLTTFTRLMSSPQQERFYAAVDRIGTADPALLIELVRYHKKGGDPDQALQVLRRVVATYWVSDQVSRRDLEKLGREITGDDGWQIAEPDELELQSMGYRRLESGEPLEFEVRLSQPALMYRESDGQLGRYAVVVAPAEIPEGLFTLVLRGPQHAEEQEIGTAQFHIRVEYSRNDSLQTSSTPTTP